MIDNFLVEYHLKKDQKENFIQLIRIEQGDSAQ